MYPEKVCTLILFCVEDPMVYLEVSLGSREAETHLFLRPYPSYFQRQGKDTMNAEDSTLIRWVS